MATAVQYGVRLFVPEHSWDSPAAEVRPFLSLRLLFFWISLMDERLRSVRPPVPPTVPPHPPNFFRLRARPKRIISRVERLSAGLPPKMAGPSLHNTTKLPAEMQSRQPCAVLIAIMVHVSVSISTRSASPRGWGWVWPPKPPGLDGRQPHGPVGWVGSHGSSFCLGRGKKRRLRSHDKAKARRRLCAVLWRGIVDDSVVRNFKWLLKLHVRDWNLKKKTKLFVMVMKFNAVSNDWTVNL